MMLNQTVSIKEQPVAFRRQVNFCEAEPTFPEFLTGYELINLFASAQKATTTQKDMLIESMKINQFLGKVVATNSSGMLKRLPLVLAFLGTSSIVLLDEPLNTSH